MMRPILLVVAAFALFLGPLSFALEETVFGVGEGPCSPQTMHQPVRIVVMTIEGQKHAVHSSTSLQSLKGNANSGYRFRTSEEQPLHIPYREFKSIIPVCHREAEWQRHAVGKVTIKRTAGGLPLDVYLPPGLRLTTLPEHVGIKQRFHTTEGVILNSDESQVIVDIIAEKPGPNGAVDAGEITVFDPPILTIGAVRNDQPTRVPAPRRE